ncbi:hypothetical protein FHS19_002782 [Paenibacillus rhizosphaerae]|uniref:Uncharacterized protein n=1 Tax=Paenibacillus rhizosphaerae TaxID=297318 RepID=A0A839TRV0_9BACL|nr:hypothetical protein [Paenibacillus rhizosphaerae]
MSGSLLFITIGNKASGSQLKICKLFLISSLYKLKKMYYICLCKH